MAENIGFYDKDHPEIDQVVIIKIDTEGDLGYDVSLLEYANQEAFLPFTEIFKRRTRKKKGVKIGQIIPVIVLDINKGHIDVSKKRMPENLIGESMRNYQNASRLFKLGVEINKFYDTNDTPPMSPKDVMVQTVWPLQEASILFDKLLVEPEKVFESSQIDPDFTNQYLDNMKNRIKCKNLIMEMNIQLAITCPNGLAVLKEILDLSIITVPEKLSLKIVVDSPPIYKIKVKGNCEDTARNLLNTVKVHLQTVCEHHGVGFRVHEEPYIAKGGTLDFHFMARDDNYQLA